MRLFAHSKRTVRELALTANLGTHGRNGWGGEGGKIAPRAQAADGKTHRNEDGEDILHDFLLCLMSVPKMSVEDLHGFAVTELGRLLLADSLQESRLGHDWAGVGNKGCLKYCIVILSRLLTSIGLPSRELPRHQLATRRDAKCPHDFGWKAVILIIRVETGGVSMQRLRHSGWHLTSASIT